ncbi:TnsA endonuclease N-terminal domain-containing protein [Lacrimispora sp. 210928-DFI.3.58]|uniref:TnsA endonuclease N-terminal domain-containing protein n=1 Tax=Lacrimispora sp. 210928-DFI.3.58 TaxID=2883214 RepID=UPI001D06D3E9|nr:TnsA endonuclease N-terminal domain-containing protein [Lacrimispora sp. 210928-DFI.3.58]MCB7319892.1 TnsA endonuclease N-terminal domain-containing protein [Lacrimispora sp. 210928-DFI.3.58]
MRQKSDKSKYNENRCVDKGKDYKPWIKTNEAKSTATAAMIPIPDGRSVSTLSGGERNFFYIMYFRDDVKEIEEQRALDMNIIGDICKDNGFKKPSRTITTDFLITFTDRHKVAYSLKYSRDILKETSGEYKLSSRAYQRLLERQVMEMEYWKRLDVGFKLVFGNELDKNYAENIQTVMRFWKLDDIDTTNAEDVLKYLVAHKLYPLDLEHKIVHFAAVAREREKEIWEVFRNV